MSLLSATPLQIAIYGIITWSPIDDSNKKLYEQVATFARAFLQFTSDIGDRMGPAEITQFRQLLTDYKAEVNRYRRLSGSSKIAEYFTHRVAVQSYIVDMKALLDQFEGYLSTPDLEAYGSTIPVRQGPPPQARNINILEKSQQQDNTALGALGMDDDQPDVGPSSVKFADDLRLAYQSSHKNITESARSAYPICRENELRHVSNNYKSPDGADDESIELAFYCRRHTSTVSLGSCNTLDV